MAMTEWQFDGLPGSTHLHGGLSAGNLASRAHADAPGSPRAAARQCLAKMRLVHGLGAAQAFLPPLERPDVGFLRACGFRGDDRVVWLAAVDRQPHLARWAASCAFMWTANAATVVPSSDADDGRCHLVVANLAAMPHRALESAARAGQLRRLFRDPARVVIHDALPFGLGDEGAANHTRLGDGLHLFVHGRAAGDGPDRLPARHPARQVREAGMAVARLTGAGRAMHVRQHPAAIDAGAFHNDVVMVGGGDRVLVHEAAWADQPAELERLRGSVPGLCIAEVAAADLPLDEAVRSYLFNSQLLATPRGIVLVAPAGSAQGASRTVIERLRGDGFIADAAFAPLRESMMGGGGPACLRLRVPLNDAESATLHPGVVIDEARLALLESWVDRHYRDRLAPADLADPALFDEARAALDDLAALLDLGGDFYPFQREGA